MVHSYTFMYSDADDILFPIIYVAVWLLNTILGFVTIIEHDISFFNQYFICITTILPLINLTYYNFKKRLLFIISSSINIILCITSLYIIQHNTITDYDSFLKLNIIFNLALITCNILTFFKL